MLQPFNARAFDAFERLLAQPDPADLPRRGHVYVCEGEANRRATRYPRILTGWLQRHYMDVDGDGWFEEGRVYPQEVGR